MAKFVSARELGEILGITERRINQIVTDKQLFERSVNGKFDVVKCVEAYYRDLLLKDDYAKELDYEKVLHERAKREKAQLQVSRMKNEVHDATVIELCVTNMLATFRNRILGIPAAIAPKVFRKTVPEINNILRNELNSALSELSEYNPAMFTDFEVEYGTENDTVIQEDIKVTSPAGRH